MKTNNFLGTKKDFLALLMDKEITDISIIIRAISAIVAQKKIDEIENL